ncbi:MAG: bifunctional precorrin-2 dehydrogenase/sirohydrochlorin ferrochelatase [Pseudomonadota bacterium]
MKPYPLMMNLHDKEVLVVGGGVVALRKVESLLQCGAKVTVVSPAAVPEIERIAMRGYAVWIGLGFSEDMFPDTYHPALVFGATDDREVNVRIHEYAVNRGIPCNIADVPDLCTFIVPAVVRQGDITVAISTGGASPSLARRIREDLERHLGPEYAIMARLVGFLRKPVIDIGRSSDENKKIFMRLTDPEVLREIKDRDRESIIALLRRLLPAQIDPEPAVDHALEIPRAQGDSEWI